MFLPNEVGQFTLQLW